VYFYVANLANSSQQCIQILHFCVNAVFIIHESEQYCMTLIIDNETKQTQGQLSKLCKRCNFTVHDNVVPFSSFQREDWMHLTKLWFSCYLYST